MEKVYFDCSLRKEIGKGKVNTLRRSGFVPAVIYGHKQKSLAVKLDRSQLIKFMHAHQKVESMIINLRISGDGKNKSKTEEKSVLIKEIQLDPVRDDILHIDFNQISLTKAIQVKVPIEAKGEAIGVKQDKGTLAHVLWELEVECLPTAIPEKFEVDVTNMKIGDMIHVRDILTPTDIKVLSDKDAIVFTLVPPKKEEAAVEVPEAEVTAEPEVIKEKKEKEEEEEVAEEKTSKEKPQKEQKEPQGGK